MSAAFTTCIIVSPRAKRDIDLSVAAVDVGRTIHFEKSGMILAAAGLKRDAIIVRIERAHIKRRRETNV